ncbi:MAG: SH3 domain-containing C40 family peptidase [Bacteroidota bacterium]
MQYGISPVSIVSVRSVPTTTSEICTQLLFGELVEILDKKGRHWLKIRCQWDDTIGWVNANQLKLITALEYQCYEKDFAYNFDLMQPIVGKNHFIPVTLGAHLPNFDGLQLHLGDNSFQFSGQAVYPKDIQARPEVIQKLVRKYLYAPYLHGGRSPFGIDSAGLVQVVYQMAGIALARTAIQQVLAPGHTIDFMEQAQCGDLIFFENQIGRIAHVGILLEQQQIIHAFGHVRIDRVDHHGIFDESLGKYTHKMRLIRRVLPPIAATAKRPTVITKSAQKQFELFS